MSAGQYRAPCLVTLLAIGCATPSAGGDTLATDSATTGETSAGTTATTGGDTDGGTGEGSSGSGSTGGGDTGEGAACPDGLPRHTFEVAGADIGYDLVAPDFTVETMRGPFTLSEAWTGCDHYVIVLRNPDAGPSGFWLSDKKDLVGDSAENVTYLFMVSGVEDDATRAEAVQQLGAQVESELKALGEDVYDAATMRFRYVLDDADSLPLVQAVLAVSPREEHFVIDRHQLVREGHSVSEYVNTGFKKLMRNVRHWPRYYDWWYAEQNRLAIEETEGEVLVHRVVDHTDVTSGEPFTWSLPPAAELEGYNHLDVVMEQECEGPGHPYHPNCGEWDVATRLFQCDAEGCDPEARTELLRWITAYSAPTRAVFDATFLLPWLATGGDRSLMFESAGYTYKYTVDLRFSKVEGPAPVKTVRLWPDTPLNNSWGPAYLDLFPDWTLAPPAGATSAMLTVRATGHGAVEGSNCAEFCSYEHELTVNGTPYSHEYLMEPLVLRCEKNVSLGVTPNQGGTWHFDRSSWCPGWVVEEWSADITEAMTFDGSDVLRFSRTERVGGAPPPGEGANMDAAYFVTYFAG